MSGETYGAWPLGDDYPDYIIVGHSPSEVIDKLKKLLDDEGINYSDPEDREEWELWEIRKPEVSADSIRCAEGVSIHLLDSELEYSKDLVCKQDPEIDEEQADKVLSIAIAQVINNHCADKNKKVRRIGLLCPNSRGKILYKLSKI